jgi:hypothetical protein
MLSTAAGTPLLARATAPNQTADTNKATVDRVPTMIETNTTGNARHGFDYLDEQYEGKRQIDDGYDE